MAFKMKGSPAKMGGIQGTAGHTSALKQREAEVSALKQASPVKNYSMDWGGENKHNTAHTKHNAGKGPDPHGDEKKSPTEMKSPMKDEKEYGPYSYTHNTKKATKEHHGDPHGPAPVKQKYERVNPTEYNPEGKDVKVTTKRGKTKTYSKDPDFEGSTSDKGVTKTTSRKVGALEGLLTKKKKGDVVTKTKKISENKAMNQLERAKNKADRKGTQTTTEKKNVTVSKDKKGRDRYSGTTTVTTTGTKKRKKLFGGKKTTTKSASRTYNVDAAGGRGPETTDFPRSGEEHVKGARERRAGTETTVHTRKKKRGGGVKKKVTIDASGKKTVTRYDKEGNVKGKPRVRDTKRGNRRRQERLMDEGSAGRKALKKEDKNK